MKRNFTRVKLKTSNFEIIAMSSHQLHESGWFVTRPYVAQKDADDAWSLTFDVLQEFHPMPKKTLFTIEFYRAKLGTEFECEDFEITVIEYQNSKNPVIRKFDDSSVANYKKQMDGGMRNEIDLVMQGDIEAGHRIFEHIANMDIVDDHVSQQRVMAFLGVMKDTGMIPQGHLVDALKERFAHALKYFNDDEDKNAFQSWFDAACLKARSMLTPASNAPRHAATI